MKKSDERINWDQEIAYGQDERPSDALTRGTGLGAKIGEKGFAFLVATFATMLIFSTFVGLKLNEGFIPFQSGTDSYRQCFPSFCMAWRLPLWNGVDIGTFNGATELAFRVNMPFQYPFTILFSALGHVTRYKAAYILFYAFHMWAFVYFGVLLARRFFGLDRKYACLYALSSLSVLFTASWYSSHYIVASLTAPMLYCSLRALKRLDLAGCLQCAFLYVCGYLSGYAPVSVFECGFVLLLTLVYGFTGSNDKIDGHGWKTILVRAFLPFLIGSAVAVLHLLQVFIYTSTVVQTGKVPLKTTTALPFVPKDWLAIISLAFTPMNSIEMLSLPHMGWSWCVMLGVTVIFKRYGRQRESYQHAWISWVSICTLLLLFLASGTNTPIAYWFYTVPILGAMHLPMRFFLVVFPFFFLACAAFLYHNREVGPHMERALWAVAAATAVALCWFLFKRTYSDKLNENYLIVELVMLLASIVLIIVKGGITWSAVALFALGAVMFPLQTLYSNVLLEKWEYEGLSIVYSDSAKEALSSYIDLLPDRDRYKFANLDTKEAYASIPEYVPNNLAWYLSDGENTLSEYLGYELHLGTPKDYLNRMPGFDRIDWNYVADTRGDFAIVSPSVMAAQSEQLWKVIDQEKPTLVLQDGSTIYQLKKFIPSYYTGELFVEDTNEAVLDNGYFYCPYLSKADLVSFETNKTNDYSATIRSNDKYDIAFTLYPNRYYHYYVDGEEIEPVIYDMQAFIPVEAGEHQIEVKYKNPANVLSIVVLMVFYAMTVCISAIAAVFHLSEKTRRKLK